MQDVVRAAALAAGVGADGADLVECVAEPIVGDSGATTAEVARLTGRIRVGNRVLPFAMIRKTFRPVAAGRHAVAARARTHWAYWRREPLAYATGVVPRGPDLAGPRCFLAADDVVYLAEVTAATESAAVAARRLAAWQRATPVPDVAWLSGHQLAQRIAVSSLDWSAVDAPGTLRQVWDRRHELLAALRPVPTVMCHGDFHIRNLVAGGDVTIVLDWGTVGTGPLGADLAHLALSTGEDPVDAYLDGLDGQFDPELAVLGYRVTLALTATSRVHWMLSRGMPVPPAYVRFATAAMVDVRNSR